MAYDDNNVFAKIIRGELPADKVVENEFALAFRTRDPLTEIHVLIVPKGKYENILDFVSNASAEEQAGFWRLAAETARALGIKGDYNVAANSGSNAPVAKQTVFHFHLHLMAGEIIRKPHNS
ncbi:MAG: HIT domain-containing protein [Rickettsiales bacterium]|jgi:diadenosine tetraphosphate (Ap4A) HIT family hydrolase|nr:HIT domain-containing protein [Rickettsiales bacterium]